MFVELHGDAGPPVLLLHGGGVAGWMWRPFAAELRRPLRLLVPDLPGHGRSAATPYTSHAATLEALTALLRARGEPVAVVGFSLGAQLAVLLAATAPELVSRVLVVSAQAKPVPFVGPTLALLDLTLPLARRRWFSRLQARELFIPDALFDVWFETSAAMTRESLRAAVGENLRFTVPPGWARFPGPALVLAGEKEAGLMKRSAELLHQALPGSTLERFEGCGHGIPLQQPARFARRLERWLDDGVAL